jgi:hypothetical protein
MKPWMAYPTHDDQVQEEGRAPSTSGGFACVYDSPEEMCVHYSCIIGYLCLLNKEKEEEEEDKAYIISLRYKHY